MDYLLLGGRRRGFTPKASVSSSITHRVLSMCLHLSFLNLCHLISAVDVILFGLDFFINSVLAYIHVLHIHCLIISLNWYFVIWRSKRSRCNLGVFCYSCILASFSSGLLTAWRATERFYAEDFGFLFDNTSLCCPCVCISLTFIFAI